MVCAFKSLEFFYPILRFLHFFYTPVILGGPQNAVSFHKLPMFTLSCWQFHKGVNSSLFLIQPDVHIILGGHADILMTEQY